MIVRILICLSVLVSLAPAAAVRQKPKIVVAIVIDQFRYDYLTRFRDGYTGGLLRLLEQGAVFSDAQYEHFPTVTAIGHGTLMTGAIPAMSGIAGNEWYDRASGKVVTSVSDDSVQLLGGKGEAGASPQRLMVSTVGDELKMANGGKSKVIGISFKDRAAILPAGHMANGAYWFSNKTGSFVSSSFYFSDMPGWVMEFNRERASDRYAGVEWKPFKQMPAAGEKLWAALAASPYGNELIEAFAERAIRGERLGRNTVTDLLTVSFSSNDYVGHSAGPDSPQVRDISIRTDALLQKFIRFVEDEVGASNVLWILAGDHGVAPLPETAAGFRLPAGRVPGKAVLKAVEAALNERYGEGAWIERAIETSFYLNRALIREKRLSQAEVEDTAAEAARAAPHVFRVYTRTVLNRGYAMADPVGRRVANGFTPGRSGDVIAVLDPYWLAESGGTSHGTPFGYDAHVPVIFMGSGIKPGAYRQRIMPNDIAPTLAAILEVDTPSGSVGRVLTEILE